jgi:hypothetical protein
VDKSFARSVGSWRVAHPLRPFVSEIRDDIVRFLLFSSSYSSLFSFVRSFVSSFLLGGEGK